MNRFRIAYLAFLIIGIILISCSPHSSNRMLNFFFDGVPEATILSGEQTTAIEIPLDSLDQPVSANEIQRVKYFHHTPYLKKNCEACHSKQYVGEIITPQPELCYKCHERVDTKYKFLHGPVDAGYCSSCHNPHGSKFEGMIISDGNSLCYICHDSASPLCPEPHKLEEDAKCTNCHNPHGSDNKHLLIKAHI